MKKYLIMIAAAALAFAACEKTPKNEPVDVKVTLEKDGAAYEAADITVSLLDASGTTSYDAQTDETGTATFSVLPGFYTASVSFKTAEDGVLTVYNAMNSDISVAKGGENTFALSLVASVSNQIIIKEVYAGGCKKDDGKAYQYDRYITLYNNSDTEADASDICFGFAMPFNSNATSNWLVDGELSYAAEGWIPAGYGLWWFNTNVTIPAYSQIVVAVNGAIDHTATYSNSVDLSNPAYYAMYDPEAGFNNASYYPAPSDAIPTDHYLKGYLFGAGNAWPLSTASPALFICKNSDIYSYATTEANLDHTLNAALGACVKITNDMIVDAVEMFAIGKESKNAKRLPAALDAGYIYYNNAEGYTAYRNVDEEATKAIEGNEEKLVYNYSLGTEAIDQTTDPSGIDAEASIANGAKIVYMDTNNSTKDFHLRSKASLKN